MSELQKNYYLKTVRVEVEHEKHVEHFGEFGTVTKTHKASQELTVQTDFKAFTLSASLVAVRAVRECQVRGLATFNRLSLATKLSYLHELGHWDAEASAPITKVTLAKPIRLEDEQIMLWSVVLRTTFPKVDFEFFDPTCFLRRLLGDHAEPEVYDFLAESVRSAYMIKSVLLFPLQCRLN